MYKFLHITHIKGLLSRVRSYNYEMVVGSHGYNRRINICRSKLSGPVEIKPR